MGIIMEHLQATIEYLESKLREQMQDIEETKKKVPASSPSPRLPLLADNEDDPCKLRRLTFLPEPRS